MDIRRPRALRAGDVIAVLALSGPMGASEVVLLERGVEVLTGLGFQVRVSPLADPGARRWWTAAHPRELAAEFNAAMRDPGVRGIVSLNGGRATLSYLDLIDYAAIRADPKPILGFSDISSLLLAVHQRTGVVTFHAEMATYGFGEWAQLPAIVGDELADMYRRVLTRAEPAGPLPNHGTWECWAPGRVTGPLLGGMLNRVVRGQAGAFAFAPSCWDGAVLFWEESAVAVSAIWLDLHALRSAGILDRIGGMVVGAPDRLQGVRHTGVSLRRAVLDVLDHRDIPVMGNVDIGHRLPNLPLPLGVDAELDSERGSLTLTGPAVA